MLSKATFSMDHIQSIKNISEKDPILIERVLYAFGLLEALIRVGTPLTFNQAVV